MQKKEKEPIQSARSEVAISAQGSTMEKVNRQDKVTLIFNRNNGFSHNSWKTVKSSFTLNGYKLAKKYTKRIENELDFRFVTTKKLELVILVVLSISSLLLFILDKKQSGYIFVGALILFIYLLSVIKAIKLNDLIKKFNSDVTDLDEKYFGVKITNMFGKRKPWFYALVPIVRPDIVVNIQASEFVSLSLLRAILACFQPSSFISKRVWLLKCLFTNL
jgi:hypothetical protein